MTEDFDPEVPFLDLHATLAHQPELIELRAGGTPLRTILNLYPQAPETYLPYFRARFKTRDRQRKDPNWAVEGMTSPFNWELQELLDACTSADERRYWNDARLGPRVVALIEEHYDSELGHNWNRSNLTFEITSVLDLTSRLLNLDMVRYAQMPRRYRSELQVELAALAARFRTYESGLELNGVLG